MRKLFLIFFIIVAQRAGASLPDCNFVSEFYYDQCNNQRLSVPGAGQTTLVGRQWLLSVVDELNAGATTYVADAADNNIVSLDYLTDTVSFLGNSMTCCLGGVVGDDEQCRACGTWTRETAVAVSCLGAGEYFNGTKCVTCPDGYICPGGTSFRTKCGIGYWCTNNVRTKCEYGRRQCPGQSHTTQNEIIACDNALTFTN